MVISCETGQLLANLPLQHLVDISESASGIEDWIGIFSILLLETGYGALAFCGKKKFDPKTIAPSTG